MDPSTLIVEFSDCPDTRTCGRDSCRRRAATCTGEERAEWRRVDNSLHTAGDASRWICGPCYAVYLKRVTTQAGAGGREPCYLWSQLLIFSFSVATVTINDTNRDIFNINQHVAAVQKGRGVS